MNQYSTLFQIHLEHRYFQNTLLHGLSLSPTKESHALFNNHGLVLKEQQGVYTIYFANPHEGIERDRESVLQVIGSLQFMLTISDPLFRTYTGNLDVTLDKKILWFTNFDEQQHALKTSNVLHISEFVSESDVRPIPDTLHCFGLIEIRMGANLPQDFYIRFLNRSIHWRYLIVDTGLQNHEKIVILGEGNEKRFSEPEEVDLHDGSKGIAFTSIEPIAITQRSEHFDLISYFDENASHSGKTLLKGLPTPDLSTLSNLAMFDIYVYI